MRIALVLSAGLLAYAAWEWSRMPAAEEGAEEGGERGGDWLGADNVLVEGYDMAKGFLGGWRAPAKYAAMVQAAEAAHGIPAGMLERLLYQESRYREDIITGKVASPAGALGIAQFMPATAREMGINPLNPVEAIPAAAKYLASLYRRFGTWDKALAAYNWGMGNVQRKGLEAAPLETRLYYTSILSSLGMA